MKTYRLHSSATRTSRLDYAGELNDEQRAVVTRGPGPALVIAGAGSGKTRTITWRVAWLIEQGVPPGEILLVTFTNKAAREMLSRVDALFGGGDVGRKVMGGTFHHVGNVLLRKYADRLGYAGNFTILDPEDRADLLQSVLGECAARWRELPELAGKDALTERRFPQASVLGSMISDAVNRQKNLSDVIRERQPWFEPIAGLITDVAVAFARRKRERQVMDFDDLLLHWKRLLETDGEVRKAMRDRFRHVLVDEYQDTNKLQADIIDAIGAPAGNVMVVGDDCQSIYSFRGAHFANIMEFPQRYPGCQEYRLESNYRSTPEILALANRVIEFNRNQFPKVLKAVRAARDEKPALVPCRDPQQQAEFVAQRVLELRDQGRALSEIAVLYRNHAHSLEVQVEMARRGIPFEVRSGMRFFERAHVKDVLCHLRMASNPRDEVAWTRVARLLPKVGTATAEKIWRYVEGAGSVAEMARRLSDHAAEAVVPAPARASWARLRETWLALAGAGLAERPAEQIAFVAGGEYADVLRARFTDARSRLEDLERLASFASQYPDTATFLAEVTLLTEMADDDAGDPDPESKVTLSTVHRAKGLEWGAVFVIWTADGQFPAMWGTKDPEDEEEERRLFYVAVTRAKDELHLSYPTAETRRDGRAVMHRPSRFLAELWPPLPYERWQLEDEPPEVR